jgi:hypothetical protein
MTTSHVFVPVPSQEVDFYQLLLLSGDKSLRFPRAVGCVIVVYYIVDHYYYTFFSITHSSFNFNTFDTHDNVKTTEKEHYVPVL